MTTATSAALLAMRQAEDLLGGGLDLLSGFRNETREVGARQCATGVDLLRAAIAHEEARLDPRLEVVACVLAPAAFNVTESGYSSEQAAEARRIALTDAREVLDALDAYTHARNTTELDATIGRGSTS